MRPCPPIPKASTLETATRTADGSVDDTDDTSDTEGSGTAPQTPALAPGQAFGPRYQVTRVVGEGGMGAVYEAFDKELGLSVALKVILPEKMGTPKKAARLERRFKRELLLGRKVTHKNVIRIHDIGETDGIKYITMPYIEGSDLSHVLKEAGEKLPVPRALRIARTVLSGLTAAHDAGVVHRDLKPANIMIDADDEAYIMDFGIATAADDTDGSATSVDGLGTSDRRVLGDSPLLDSRTQQGRVVGTVQYMAPEQARGQTVDKRADLYAFGLILYDMLVGRHRANTSSSALDEVTVRMKTAAATVRSIDADLPEALEKIIDRCVQPDPDDRYPHPHALQAALDRLDEEGRPLPITRRLSMRQVAALVGVVVASLVSAFWVVGPRETPPPPDPVSVVIADLENRTDDAAFDGTLEPMLRRVLEGAGFITAYDRSRIGGLGVPRPDRLDEAAARALAVNQGLGVVLSGSIDPRVRRLPNPLVSRLRRVQAPGDHPADLHPLPPRPDRGRAVRRVRAPRRAPGGKGRDALGLKRRRGGARTCAPREGTEWGLGAPRVPERGFGAKPRLKRRARARLAGTEWGVGAPRVTAGGSGA